MLIAKLLSRKASALPKKCEQSTGALTPQGQGAGAGGPSARASRGPGLTPALAHSRVAAAHALASLHAGGGGGRPPGRCGWRLDVRVPGSPGPERVRPPQVSPEALTRVVPACQAGGRAAPTGLPRSPRPWRSWWGSGGVAETEHQSLGNVFTTSQLASGIQGRGCAPFLL